MEYFRNYYHGFALLSDYSVSFNFIARNCFAGFAFYAGEH